ncbi:tycC [Symbiodinium necroappetens]|uniref:TycC protein n=1 Tax=Symbiodinium necroappetens TaxID=1628268 RepID=A0A813B6H4_9DINO|nr:tycC [Symbiodinium necroappetens]
MTALALVQQSVASCPDQPALRFLTTERTLGCLTYRQVWQLSGLIADRLQGGVLGVAIDDGPYLALAELAGWRRGMVLVPLDPHDPVSRLCHVAKESQATCLVTKDWGDAKKLAEIGRVLDLSTEVPLSSDLASPEPETLAALDPTSPAYMWFTSGSTGQPKGVLISHQAFCNWCKVKNPPQSICSSSVVLIASASTFDPSIGDIFATWAVGGTVAVAPRMLFFANLGWAIDRLEVTHVTCTPSLWQSLENGMDLPSLTSVCLGGERAPQPLLDQWAPALKLLNTYGTTECTVWQTLRHMLPGDRATLVGRPYPGNEVRIFERDGLAQQKDDEVGEIVQGGVQVGIGYHNRPELTAAKFVELPNLPGRWYRTGDGGRLLDGELEVMGRFDNQVKIRGMRVELGEIESAVVQTSSGIIANCSVKLRDGFLVAYCQVSVDAAVMMHEPYCVLPVVSDFLLTRSSTELPRHMLPSRFVLMQRLPLTQNGKVDTKALPESVDVSSTSSSSLTALERVVASVWEEVLKRSGVGPNDHFLALGGHSMSVLQVSRRLVALATAAGQDASPASPLGIILSPEKLIHSPRLRIYCQMLARGGVRFPGTDASMTEEKISEEDVAELRINYVKHKVQRGDRDPELDHGAWEQVPEDTAEQLLCRAAEAGLVPLVRLLLREGAPVEGGTLQGQYARHGSTPLILAVMGNHVCCAEELLQHRAQPQQRDAHGTPTLLKAAERCGQRMVELLLEARADVEATDTASRSTSLHAAAKAGNPATATALLQGNAGADWLDRWNRTPLHWAVFHGHVEVCQVLVEAGARTSGTVGEHAGRFFIATEACGNLPHRVLKQTASFVTPRALATERFPDGGPIRKLLDSKV